LGHRNFHDLVLFSLLEPCQLCTEACHLYRVGGCVFGAYNRGKSYASPVDWVGGVGEEWFERMIRGVEWRRGG
jgi:tRNA(Arg) A34 adenosine deaminase TadA